MSNATKTPKMERVLINFPPSYLAEVRDTAAEMGLSLPELVRIAVSHWSVCADGERSLRRKIAQRVLAKEPSETVDDYEERLQDFIAGVEPSEARPLAEQSS